MFKSGTCYEFTHWLVMVEHMRNAVNLGSNFSQCFSGLYLMGYNGLSKVGCPTRLCTVVTKQSKTLRKLDCNYKCKPGVVASACNSSIWEAEAGGKVHLDYTQWVPATSLGYRMGP